MNSVIDFGFAWNWEYDADFARLLEVQSQTQGLSLLHITPENVENVTEALVNGSLRIRALWDRAADSDERFLRITGWADQNAILQINPHVKAVRAWNKATMHLEFITAGVNTPYTIILDPYNAQPVLRKIDLSVLGGHFIIKPVHGGGGVGVILNAVGLERVLAARREHPDDYYLLQAFIEPVQLNGRPAWFRVIYNCGQVYFCWWNVQTHIYTPFSESDENALPILLLNEILSKIANITGLDVFSSEIALTADNRFVVVDYINDPLDLRLKSVTPDGIPDAIAQVIAHNVVSKILTVISPDRSPC
jgi:hypothetical protein